MPSSKASREEETACSIACTLEVVGDKWTFLILREAALRGVTRFADFRRELGIAADMLTGRLAALVDEGIMEKRPYREPGSRTRYSYHLTPAGEELRLILAALQQWGDVHRTPARGPSHLRRSAGGGRPVSVAFVDDTGTVLSADEVRFTPAEGAEH
ncbi:winged helix-turn-helix transcriptional regulator [Streptomyces sp. NPDC001070]